MAISMYFSVAILIVPFGPSNAEEKLHSRCYVPALYNVAAPCNYSSWPSTAHWNEHVPCPWMSTIAGALDMFLHRFGHSFLWTKERLRSTEDAVHCGGNGTSDVDQYLWSINQLNDVYICEAIAWQAAFLERERRVLMKTAVRSINGMLNRQF